ncbi:MAG: hypothetical protein QOF31_4030 [Mycobacterium sp.]|nr:hypothetical protein [Mycobacterium sp.]
MCPATVLAAATTWSGSVTSHRTAMTFGKPNQRVRSGELFRYAANTCQPSRWSRTTSASPIPVAAPVMKADLIGEPYPNLARRPGVLLMPARRENDDIRRVSILRVGDGTAI